MHDIDKLKRKLLEQGVCIDCVDKAIALVAEYANNAYTEGYDRGYDAGYTKGFKRGLRKGNEQ